MIEMSKVYFYILIMAGITYLIRVLPFLILRHEIKNHLIRSFLYYVPYATLAAMTFPAILYAAETVWAGAAALAAAIYLSWRGKSLFTVSAFACVSALIVDLIFTYIPIGA